MALGEIGLDYHYDHSPRATQRAVFADQLRIARDARLPIVIHAREAWEDTMRLLCKSTGLAPRWASCIVLPEDRTKRGGCWPWVFT